MSAALSIEPPGLALVGDDDDPPGIEVHVALIETDGTTRTATITLPDDATDHDLAHAFVCCVHGCAATRGPGLRAAVLRWIPTP